MTPETTLLAISPLLAVIGLAMAIVVLDIIRPERQQFVAALTAVGLLFAIAITLYAGYELQGIAAPRVGETARAGTEIFGGSYVLDELTTFLHVLFLAIALLTVLFAPDYLRPRGLPMAEFSATLLFAISGAMLMAGSRDLLLLFLGLELMVLPGYMLAGFAKRDGLSTEGAIKYFLLGSFSSSP
jgi:NADH-quinone oxidoreductase subunit N